MTDREDETGAAHAHLGPSSAERWISCPASIRFAAQFEHDDHGGHVSAYAAEGTLAHELAAMRLEQRWGLPRDLAVSAWRGGHPEIDDEQWADMNRFVAQYVDFVMNQAGTMTAPQLAVEVKVDPGVPDCWGTADAVLFSPWEIKVVDFKYGQGVAVEVEDNPQLKLYALGVLERYQDLLGLYTEVQMSIVQPRIGIFKTVTYQVDDLYCWRDEVVTPAARLTADPDAPFGPSEAACRWCPARGRCRAQLSSIFEDTVNFDDDPNTLTPGEIGDALDAAPRIKAWLGHLEEAALTLAYSEGTPIPGYKVIMSGGRRKIEDPAHAIQALIDAGFPAQQTSTISIKGFGDLEKLVGRWEESLPRAERLGGRERLKSILGDLIVAGEGKASLVAESDRRAPITPETEAQKVFKEEEE